MKYLLLFLLIASMSAIAGGDSFDIRVVEFTRSDTESAQLIFVPLNAPYGQSVDQYLKGQKRMVVEIEYACSQGLACFTTEHSFTKQQHKDAIDVLAKIALPNTEIRLGVISSGFEAIDGRSGYYRSNGAVILNGTVFLYFNSHI